MITVGCKYVSYLRVSTARQGISGLGLEAQRATVATFLNGGSWEIVSEFVKVESGKNADRLQLACALTHCRIAGSTRIIANVSRLTRSFSFLSRLLEAGLIGERTRKALAAAKASGRKFALRPT